MMARVALIEKFVCDAQFHNLKKSDSLSEQPLSQHGHHKFTGLFVKSDCIQYKTHTVDISVFIVVFSSFLCLVLTS